MKRIFTLIIILVATSFATQGFSQEQKIRKSFYEELSSIYTIEGDEIYIREVMQFPGKTKDQLESKVRDWLSNRIERRNSPNMVNNSDITYRNNTFMFSERTRKWGVGVYANYNLVIEIKEGRVRLTAYISSYWWGESGPEIPSQNFYPFKSISDGKRMLKLTGEYILEQFQDFKKAMLSETKRPDDDW
ncbi:MAG: hypothetical protein IKU64_06780 [Bacteroides sp.]|nr:hypothetical protein [Bacteroides sp.]